MRADTAIAVGVLVAIAVWWVYKISDKKHSSVGQSAPADSVSLKMRDTLFGDMTLDVWGGQPDGGSPWSEFAAARTALSAGRKDEAIQALNKIVAQPNLESRMYLQAWHFLRQLGQQPPATSAKEVLGVVIEVPMPGGLDILAAYKDHTARFYSHSNAAVIWERPDNSMDALIDDLFAKASPVVQQIGPWENERPSAPTNDITRLSFLTPSGLHFGQGPKGAFFEDAMAGPCLTAGTKLMMALTKAAMAKSK